MVPGPMAPGPMDPGPLSLVPWSLVPGPMVPGPMAPGPMAPGPMVPGAMVPCPWSWAHGLGPVVLGPVAALGWGLRWVGNGEMEAQPRGVALGSSHGAWP